MAPAEEERGEDPEPGHREKSTHTQKMLSHRPPETATPQPTLPQSQYVVPLGYIIHGWPPGGVLRYIGDGDVRMRRNC